MAESTTRKARVELRLIVNGHAVYTIEGFFNQSLNQGIDRSVVPEWDLEENRGSDNAIILNAKDRGLSVNGAQSELTDKAFRSYCGPENSIDIRVRYNNLQR